MQHRNRGAGEQRLPAGRRVAGKSAGSRGLLSLREPRRRARAADLGGGRSAQLRAAGGAAGAATGAARAEFARSGSRGRGAARAAALASACRCRGRGRRPASERVARRSGRRRRCWRGAARRVLRLGASNACAGLRCWRGDWRAAAAGPLLRLAASLALGQALLLLPQTPRRRHAAPELAPREGAPALRDRRDVLVDGFAEIAQSVDVLQWARALRLREVVADEPGLDLGSAVGLAHGCVWHHGAK